MLFIDFICHFSKSGLRYKKYGTIKTQRVKYRKPHQERPGAGFAVAAGSLAMVIFVINFFQTSKSENADDHRCQPWQGAGAELDSDHTSLAVLIAGLAVMVVYLPAG